MSDYEKLDYCSKCKEEVLHTFSGSGNKKTCEQCGTHLVLKFYPDETGIFDIPTWEEEKVES